MTAPRQPSTLAARLGSRLQQHRIRKGLTQSELAERANLSLKYLGEVERGEANVTVLTLARLTEFLDWEPFVDVLTPVSAAARALLLGELHSVGDGLDRILTWLATLDLSTSVPVPSSLSHLAGNASKRVRHSRRRARRTRGRRS